MKPIKSLLKFTLWAALLMVLLVTLPSAKRYQSKRQGSRPLALTSVHIVDRNGFADTITNKERLQQLQKTDFLKTQAYQKVLRIYERDAQGNVRSVVTTYHANGNPKQLLEVLNARALGAYREWHENGMLSLSTRVIGGQPDVTPAAESSWLFDGQSFAWNDEGQRLADIQYSQGVLEGLSTYYHPNGQVWKRVPYCKNQIEGITEIYKPTGELLQQVTYSQGIKQGTAVRYWCDNQLAYQEEYCQGYLESGIYFDQSGKLLCEVRQGTGFRAVFGKSGVNEMREYKQGLLEGEIRVLSPQGRLKRIYHVKEQMKHGEELEYYDYPRFEASAPEQPILQPKLSVFWYEGKIQGHVKTWYQDGTQESQREMSNNEKNGLATAWYRDGSLMLIEDYDEGKLSRGEYFKKGDKMPVSSVRMGNGLVTMFDAEGHFIQKIPYFNGKPDV